ncbi:efflux transporter outer membrane subunit [Actimicrobium sp. CCC2.4]|uniref:efflux transporter outer membrane subunit n=1 Tax=Actimicrobium sp. CCC2.4 TaxID=3048606 RepID=UPI002AC9DFCD|nr:efflux transporter outer membrane subunit [Actimicrobium sp. CCC2.4]MEB0134135.1 efflux transporter outer membrane subunit [Actimicrobium sp. CCC2.4]WPX32790.1 efflux transporter outer membrane subunit [Actimicrobium sp. CCC2.4]
MKLLLLTLLATLGGCAAGPDYVRPATVLPQSYLPEGESFAASLDRHGSDLPVQWWTLFGSAPLDALVASSLRHNPTIEAAQAALRIAQENVATQQSAALPLVEAGFSPTRQKIAGTLASPAASAASIYNLHTAQVTVSYTPDLFGGNRRQVESLQAQASQQRFMLAATYLTLTSNVANAAIQEAALRGQLAATREIIDSQTTVTAMVQRQVQLGQLGRADAAAQEALLAIAEASLPPLDKQLAIQRNLLTALAGRYASDGIAQQFTLDSLQLPASLPLTLPSTLVEQRPDVRAAEEQLHAASAAVGVAIANRLPNITLGVNAYGSSASRLADLFKAGTGFWSLAGSLTQPLFDAGTLQHRQAAAQAAYEQAAAQYRISVINAFQNVADALQAIRYDEAAGHAADRAEQAAARSLAILRNQLALGDVSALSLLVGEQAYQQARLIQIQARASRLADVVALCQALGGGWSNDAPH